MDKAFAFPENIPVGLEEKENDYSLINFIESFKRGNDFVNNDNGMICKVLEFLEDPYTPPVCR